VREGDVIAGRFALVSLAGRGGMGEVWRAEDAVDGATVALKMLTDVEAGDAARFAREARVLAQLSHSAIVRYLAHGAGDEGAWLAMEWLEGEDLAKRLSHTPLTVAETLSIARRVSDALAVAHAHGVVHRDIKPGNVFLPEKRAHDAKLLDFGIARRRIHDETSTGTGAVLGTPGYMAPEQARGEVTLDARADVFSLGCVLFECLTGRAAFIGVHAIAILAKVLMEDAPRVRDLVDVPVEIASLVDEMLSKDRDARPRDGSVLADRLRTIVVDAEARAAPHSSAPASLGSAEQCLVSVVLAAPTSRDSMGRAATLDQRDDRPAEKVLLRTLTEAKVRLESFANGAVGAVIAGTGGPATDQAARAARVALAMRRAYADVPLVLATGRGHLGGRVPVGDAIDRAAAMLSRERTSVAVRVDDTTAGLLDARFEIGGDARGLLLRGERAVTDEVRTLLGKPTRCVGREREIGMLAATFAECVSESLPRVVLVTAPPGMGKSRVRHELLSRLRELREPITVLLARADPVGAGSSLGMLSQALRRTARIQGGEPIELQRAKLRARVARSVDDDRLAETTEFLGEIANVAFPDDASPKLRQARRDAVVMGDNKRRAWEDFVVAEARLQPLLLILEDLHWGDLPTVSFIDRTLRNFPETRWMVLALARPEVDEVLPDLWASRELIRIPLGPLSRKSSETMIREALGDRVDEAAVARILARAEGNPFNLEELVRSAASGDEGVPETVLAMVQSRLERLPDEARRVLRAASIFGRTFWSAGVAALLGGEKQSDTVKECLRDLVTRELVTRRNESRLAGQEEHVFHHALVRDAAYRMLMPEDRVLGHRLGGDWLSASGENDSLTIAEHFQNGEEPERAQEMFLRAAREAVEGDDMSAAIARAERGVECGARGERLGRLRLVQADALQWRGENASIVSLAAEAMSLLEAGSAGWFEAVRRGIVACLRLGRRDDAVTLATRLTEVKPLPGAETADVIARAVAARSVTLLGERVLADALLDSIAGEIVEPAPLAMTAQARALQALSRGDTADYLARTREAAHNWERAGVPRAWCLASTEVGLALLLLGDGEGAVRTLETTLATAERLGLALAVAAARNNLGAALARVGRLAEARRVEEQAVRDFAQQQDARTEGASRIYLAEILLASGDAEAAAREAARSVELLAGAPLTRPYALATLARARLADGRAVEALELATEAMQNVAEVEEAEATVRLVHAEALDAVGEKAAAREAIVVASNRLHERAARISDATLRESFLHGVPDNAHTLALHARWSVADRG